jgi:hypothetical protein
MKYILLVVLLAANFVSQPMPASSGPKIRQGHPALTILT